MEFQRSFLCEFNRKVTQPYYYTYVDAKLKYHNDQQYFNSKPIYPSNTNIPIESMKRIYVFSIIEKNIFFSRKILLLNPQKNGRFNGSLLKLLPWKKAKKIEAF